MRYAEHKYWSIFHNCKVARLSIADQWGKEHFAIVTTETARGERPWSERRTDALHAIAEHIEKGAPGGEVRL